MTALKFGSGTRRLKDSALLVVAAMVLIPGYVYFLRIEDQKVAVAEAHRRAENPVQYLNDVRQGQGFHRFLAEFRQIYGYDRFQGTVPPFLLGRWSLVEAPKRVSDEYVPETCADSIAIEDGRIKTFGKVPIDMPVSYNIAGSTVQARTVNGALIPIRLISYDMNLHHIELTLPGQHKTLYGYLCR